MKFIENISVKTKTLAKLAFLVMVAVCSVGCIREIDTDIPGDDGELVDDGQVIMNLRMPGRFRTGNTRALDVDQEREVKNLWVLIFDDNRLIDITKATSRGESSFSVALPSALPGTVVKLVLLANSEDIIASSIGFDPDEVPDRDYADLMPLIKASISGPMFLSGNDRIPMWGESGEDIEIKTGVQNTRVTLMRSVARIDVGVGRYTEDGNGSFSWNGLTAPTGDPTAKQIPFEMTSVYVIKPNVQYSVAPVLSNISNAGSDAHPSAVSPSVPAGTTQFNSFRDISSEEVFRFEVTNGTFTTQDIYIPEADVVSGQHRTRMALVVGGRFADDPQETYYRVDFTDGNTYDNVLRNHLYSFSVMNVMNSGMSSVEEAYNSQAVNMSVDVLDWDEAIINNIWFEGSYYFAMDRQSVMFSPFPGETLSINIKTNIDYFDFIHTSDTNPVPVIRLSSDPGGPHFFDGAQRYGYQFTLIKKEPTLQADDEYVLQIYNPRDNIGAVPDDRLIDWTIRALNMQIHFHVDQQFTQGIISLQDGQGRFIAPEGNPNTPIPIEIYSQYPVELMATDTATGQSADWIDFGDTSGLTSGDASRDYFFYNNNLVVDHFEYGVGRDGTTDRTAVINVYIPDTGANVNYTITQQAPYVRIDRETVSAPRPLSGTGTATLPVYVYTNIQPGDLIVAKADGGDDLLRLVNTGGLLEQYDPRNPGNRRFEVRVTFDSSKEGSYGATFVVSDRFDVYGDLPDESIDVVVPPANQIFDAFWYEATFFGSGLWQPTALVLPLNESNYVFPWNTTSLSAQALSNIGFEPDATHMSQADIGRLSIETPTPYDSSGTLLYNIAYTPEKSSYAAPSDYSLAFTSTLQPDLVTSSVHFKLGQQIFHVGENAYGSRRFDWQGHSDESNPGVIAITDNVSWRAVVQSSPVGTWFKVRAENSKGTNTGTFAWDGFSEMDDRVYAPQELGYDQTYETSPATILVNNTELQFVLDPLDFADPNDPSQPEVREATITIRNNDYDVRKLGASNPAPIVITQYNRVLRSLDILPPEGLPDRNTVLSPTSIDRTYSFNARTNLPTVWLDIWEVDATGGKIGTDALSRRIVTTGFDSENSANSLQISNISLPDPGQVSRRIKILLSAPNLTLAQEQEIGMWIQPSSNRHPDLPFTTTGILAPPGVLGVDVVTGQLTLKGSKEYRVLDQATYSEFGPVSDNTVYMVMFKRGSLVGISSYQGAGNPQTVAYSAVRDVVWAGPDYSDDATLKAMSWANIPKSTGRYPDNTDLAGFGNGLGDPCGFADGFTGNGPWKTPRATTAYVTVPPSNTITTATGVSFNEMGTWTGLPITVYGSYYSFSGGGRYYLPTIGHRAGADGLYTKMMNWGRDELTRYWVAPENQNDSTFYYLNVNFDNASIQVMTSANQDIALPIRCVPK